MDIYNEYLEFAKDIARYAGKIMLKYFNQDNGEKYKWDKTVVTLADTEINSYLISQVKEKYPNHAVDGEEEQYGESNYKWVCDPVDGTLMYARHIPVAMFSLALVIDGEPVVGVAYDPFTDSMYTAIKGQGAYNNDTKIRVNDIDLDDMRSVSNFGIWPGVEFNMIEIIKELGERTHFVSIGSVVRACMSVANGDFNAVIFAGTEHKNCDIAAAKIIVEEAGGKVTDLFGNDQRYDQSIRGALISNGKVHDEVLNVIKKYVLSR